MAKKGHCIINTNYTHMTTLEAEDKLNELTDEMLKVDLMKGITNQLRGLQGLKRMIQGIWQEGYRKGRTDALIIQKTVPLSSITYPLFSVLTGCDGKSLSTSLLTDKLKKCEAEEDYENAHIIKTELDKRKPN